MNFQYRLQKIMRKIQKKKILNRLKTNIRQWIMGMTSRMLLSCSKRKETRTPQTKPRESRGNAANSKTECLITHNHSVSKHFVKMKG